MKKTINKTKKFAAILIISLMATSCEDFLAKSDLASVPESDVFGTFKHFQGYVANMYNYVFDYQNLANNGDIMWPNFEETVSDGSYYAEWKMEVGSYLIDVTNDNQNPIRFTTRIDAAGITSTNFYARRSMWDMPWYCIRMANIALEKFPLLQEATQAEKDVILGQAYYFRAYSYFDLVKTWGGVPYLTTVLKPNDNMKFSRLNVLECYDKIVADFDSAAKYLPVNWDTHPAGKSTVGYNLRLATKGAALAYKAKALLYAGSPRETGTMTGTYQYNTDYCKKAADAAWEVINLTDPLATDPGKKVYNLLPWTSYTQNFWNRDYSPHGEKGGDKELIFETALDAKLNTAPMSTTNGANILMLLSISQYNGYASPTLNLAQKFEMQDGTKAPAVGTSGYDPTNWTDRDPRMHAAMICDRDSVIFGATLPPDNNRFAAFYNSPTLGRDRNGPGQTAGFSESGFGFKKFITLRYNNYDDKKNSAIMNKFRFIIPNLRLAEVYLLFAEAANEAYGPSSAVPGTTMSAADAVNVVRNRVKFQNGDPMPNVRSEFLTDKETFRKRIYNERSVELCFEGHRFFDVRRWYIGHLAEYDGIPVKDQQKIDFDKNHTSFTPALIRPIIFNLKDYWLPFPTDQVTLYDGFYQNPGW